ncbi:MAG: histidinol-phosphate transaminase [Bdellovibrionales bacterium]
MKVPPEIASLIPYQPGKPISETKREYGLKEVIKLASNESPLGPSAKVVAAITAALPELHRYPDGACFEMRQALSKYFNVPADWLIFGNGSDELVDMMVQIYVRPGESILTSHGAFSAYEISAKSVCAKAIHTPLTADFRFDLKAMAAALRADPSIRMVFLPNPNNPTGTYFTVAEFDAFMAVAGAMDIFVVLDEAYVEFVRAKDYPNGREYQKKFPNILLLRTMSKVFGMAGSRVGILIAPPSVCDIINRVRKPFNINSLAQVAACAAIEDTEYIERLRRLTWEGLDYYYTELKKMGLSYCPSQGNFVMFDTGRDATVVFESLLRQGVILRPVKGYGFPTHLRMSVGLPAENEAAIRALHKSLQ